MKNYVINPPKPKLLPVYGSNDYFPVRRIYCVGRNYDAHIKEMGGDTKKSTPVFFTKSRESLVLSGAKLPFPPITNNLHHEVELVIAMAGRKDIFGYAVGLDMTRRDLQAEAKKAGMPWDMAKNFDNSAPCGDLKKAGNCDLTNASIYLYNNDKLKQKSKLSHMIYSVSDIIKHLNKTIELKPGDLIFTGTPEGVGAVKPGDRLLAKIDGLPELEIVYE